MVDLRVIDGGGVRGEGMDYDLSSIRGISRDPVETVIDGRVLVFSVSPGDGFRYRFVVRRMSDIETDAIGAMVGAYMVGILNRSVCVSIPVASGGLLHVDYVRDKFDPFGFTQPHAAEMFSVVCNLLLPDMNKDYGYELLGSLGFDDGCA